MLRCCRSQEFSVEEKGVTRAASYGFVKEVEAGKEFCDISLPDFNGLVDNAIHACFSVPVPGRLLICVRSGTTRCTGQLETEGLKSWIYL